MNKKRLVALLAAAVMILGTVPAYGAEVTGTPVKVATDEVFTITGDATVNDVAKPETYVVTLPTAKAFDFYVDPYGLVGAASGTSVDIVGATGQSAIVVKDNALAVMKNQSNVDVVVDVNIAITATGGALNLVTDQALVATGDAANMFIALVPGTDKAFDAETYVATNEAIAIDADGIETSFLLEKAIYEIYVTDDNGSLGYRISDEEDNFDAVTFKLGGSINKAADWSAFKGAGSISFDVVFDVNKAVDEVVDTTTALYGVVSGTAVVAYEEIIEIVEKEAFVKVGSTWSLYTDEEQTVENSFDITKAVVTVDGKKVEWAAGTESCNSRLKGTDIIKALEQTGTELAKKDYVVVITVQEAARKIIYTTTVTVE